ncbi:unnamed protein product [Oikopleura dioica]|uniref:Uncharacterized protein n=1 Tax=Oikopleura dioica TaxID=34765 RepID=E4Z083_OIKDI|nr:unnamed protein product [Oikopleura dioica]
MPPKRPRKSKLATPEFDGYGNYDPLYMYDALNFEHRMKRYARLAIDECIFKNPEFLESDERVIANSVPIVTEGAYEKVSGAMKKTFEKNGWKTELWEKELETENLKLRFGFCKEHVANSNENLSAIRKIIEECEIYMMSSNQTVVTFLGEILKEQKKILNENQRKHKAKIEKRRKESQAEKEKSRAESQSTISSSPSSTEMAQRRIQALQKIRELNALRKAQRGDLNMY